MTRLGDGGGKNKMRSGSFTSSLLSSFVAVSSCWFLMIVFMSCVDYVHRGKEEEKSGEGNVFSSRFSA